MGASTAGGSGEQLHQHTPQVMAAVLRTWPMLSRTDARHIQALIGQRLAKGHRPDDLRHTLTDNPGGARVPGRLLIHRLQDLADPAPQHPGIKPWCGACDHRFIDHGGYVHHCPTCHPKGPTNFCPDCHAHIADHHASHTHTAWCGHCDAEQRTLRATDPRTGAVATITCPTCHPTNTRTTHPASA